jgi:arylsulfatase A-like enzyme
MVVTSDHGEMGGDHWRLEKLGYWDESFHVPLIVRDPTPGTPPGQVVADVTESVDVLPTICTRLGIEVPLQADGYPLQPFIAGEGAPEGWRSEAHWGWDFSDPVLRLAESHLGIPMAHCALDVVRGRTTKFVQFAAEPEMMPPLFFDLGSDPNQLHDLVRSGEGAAAGWEAAQRLLRWRMRYAERTLSGHALMPDGPVASSDRWR